MNRGVAARLGTMGAALALSACMMPYGTEYEGAPPAAWSDFESPDLYAAIDAADSLWEAIGDAPPDFAFAFDGAEPWAWDLQDGHRVVVEETGAGIQSYYFHPGEDGPFLAVRPGMSFGFSGETVAVVYGADGGAMPRDAGTPHLDEGVALYARGRALLRAMLQRQWRDVDSQAWIDTGPVIWGSVGLWDGGWQRHPGWGRQRDRVRDSGWQHRLTAERLRRQALAGQFRRWREGGFQGPPPGRWHKPGTGPRPGAGRPDRPGVPGRPGVDRPRQPGQGGRPPGAQPGPPRQPDAGVPRPGWQGGRPRPETGVPGRPRPGWQSGRPRPPVTVPAPTGETPGTAPAPAETPSRRPGWGGRPRPDRGEGDAGNPGRRPVPSVDGAPVQRPPRGDGPRPGWFRPRPEGAAPGAPPVARPDRGNGPRPGGFRPRPDAGAAPSPPPVARPDRGSGNWSRPVREAPTSAPRAAPPPVSRPAPPPPSRPSTDTGVRERRVDPD